MWALEMAVQFACRSGFAANGSNRVSRLRIPGRIDVERPAIAVVALANSNTDYGTLEGQKKGQARDVSKKIERFRNPAEYCARAAKVAPDPSPFGGSPSAHHAASARHVLGICPKAVKVLGQLGDSRFDSCVPRKLRSTRLVATT